MTTAIIVILSILLLASIAALAAQHHSSSRTIRDLSDSRDQKIEEARKEAREEAANTVAESNEECRQLRSQASNLQSEVARLNERIKSMIAEAEKVRENDESRRKEEENRFKVLATEILNSNSTLFRRQHQDQLAEILQPLKENIEQFKKSVTDCYSNEARERFSLMKSIEELIKTNNTIGKEARELSKALKGDSKVQGDWGEMILESILEKSGLRRDKEFFLQVTTDDEGNVLRNSEGKMLRPDAVVKDPTGRSFVIDSKVSLTAYIDAVNADDDTERDAALLRHVKSVRAHISELAKKSYQDYLGGGKTDFVMMFIPNESAYVAAMQTAPSLWQEAYNERVLIVDPTHLVSALKIIAQLWSHDRQTRNAIEIADAAGKLYDKFAGFVTDMKGIEKGIENTRKAYDEAMKKLVNGKGNLVDRAQKLKELGVKTTKSLPHTSEDN